MWSPIDVFYIVWLCNFTPCEDARLNVSDFIKTREDKIISQTIGLRDGI
jgi:hypothetical protein